jgi:hypothetical protein
MERHDSSYMTVPFIDHEIAHLTRMIRSPHWHGSKVWTVAYWRGRIGELQRSAAVSMPQVQALRALLDELEQVAAEMAQRAPKHAHARASELKLTLAR